MASVDAAETRPANGLACFAVFNWVAVLSER